MTVGSKGTPGGEGARTHIQGNYQYLKRKIVLSSVKTRS